MSQYSPSWGGTKKQIDRDRTMMRAIIEESSGALGQRQ